MTNDTLGERIKKLRMRSGLSQSQLAAQLGVSNQAISNWEMGKSNPEISILVPLANLLNVGTDELLGNRKIREDWEERWQVALKDGHPNALLAAEEALRHFPGDRIFKFRRANEEYLTAAITDDEEHRKKLLASSAQHFSDLLRDHPDCEEAGIMLVQTLMVLNREAEAREAAERLPYKDKLQRLLQHGEAEKQQLNALTEKTILELLNLLLDLQDWKAISIAEAVLDAADQDKRLIYYRLNLLMQKARLYQSLNDPEAVLSCFEMMGKAVFAYDSIAQTPGSDEFTFSSYAANVPTENELRQWVLEGMARPEFQSVSVLPKFRKLIRAYQQ